MSVGRPAGRQIIYKFGVIIIMANCFENALKGVLVVAGYFLIKLSFNKRFASATTLFIKQDLVANPDGDGDATSTTTTEDEMTEYINREKYNKIITNSIIHIWKKFDEETQKGCRWYDAENEEMVKHIISQFLPDYYLYLNNLLVVYNEVSINSVPVEAIDDLKTAIETQSIIHDCINEIYDRIKNSYMNEIDAVIIE